jgi:SAM-dependent methyltransferase
MIKSYSLHIDEEYHGICQSYASGANSKDKDINKILLSQATAGVEVRSYDTVNISHAIDWKETQNRPEYLESISSFITEIIPKNFDDSSYFDISHSEGRLTHYRNKLSSVFIKDKNNHQKQRWLEHTLEAFSWYFQADIPASQILCFGCGYGYELFFLRHKYPDAIITAVDWINKVPESILEKLNISFHESNIYDFLKSNPEKYDLIYSSQVLEHAYEIDDLLNLLNAALVKGGVLESCLPLCAFENTLYSNFLERVLEGKSPLRQLDCTMLDLGHPWKTNQHDLLYSLQKAQFQNIEILGNEKNCVRGRKISFSHWKKKADSLFNLHLILLNSFKNIIYLFLEDPLPYSIVNFNSHLDWKLGFGGGHIANFVPEVFFTAYKK